MAFWLRIPPMLTAARPQFSRLFSWKSRLNRDPELRQRKLESLNKRYTLRRLGELEDEPAQSIFNSSLISQTRTQTASKLSSTLGRLSKLSNVTSIEKSHLRAAKVGETVALTDLVASISFPSPRSAVIVVKDRGNTERVLKALKREFPHLHASLMDRERVELKLPKISEELREKRGQLVDLIVEQTKKDLKRLELQTYDAIKKQPVSKAEMMEQREQVENIFRFTVQQLEKALADALDDLGLEPS